MKKTIQTILLLCLTLLASRINAQSDCNFGNHRYPTLAEKTKAADVIVEGEVIGNHSFESDIAPRIFTATIIRVSKVFKGQVKDTIVEMIQTGGSNSQGSYGSSDEPIRYVGTSGIFFLRKNENMQSGIKNIQSFFHVCSSNLMIHYEFHWIHRASGQEGVYDDLETELFEKIESLTGQKRKVMGLNGFEKEDLFKFKKKIEVKAYKTTSGPCDQENGLCTIIDYAFANVSLSANGQILDFDIVSRDEQNALVFSKGDIYINYDANTFGSNIVSNNNIIATQGSLIASPDYLLTLTDQAANTLRLSVGHVLNPTSLNTIGLVDQQLAHLTLYMSNLGSNGNIAFDNGMMQGNTDYWDNGTATDQSYTVVNVGRMLSAAAISTSSIDYRLSSVSHTAAPGYLTFDIQAQSNDAVMFHRAEVIVDYNDVTFGPNVHSNGNLHCTRAVKGDDGSNPGGVGGTGSQHGNDIYYMTVADQSSSAFSMTIDGNGYYDLVNNTNLIPADITSYTTLATCSLTVQECCHGGVMVSIDTNSTGNYASADNSSGNTVQVDTDYIVTASSSYIISSLCQPATPSISSFSPTSVPAGTFEVLTISGTGFGCIPGQVEFTRASSSVAGTMHTQPSDILSWTDYEITTLVPSCQNRYNDGLTAGTGLISVILPNSGGSTSSSQILTVPYALINDRDTTNMHLVRVGLSGSHNKFHFTPDATIGSRPDALASITHAMMDWKCTTGVTFNMDTPLSSTITSALGDGINSITFGNTSNAAARTYIHLPSPCTYASGDEVAVIDEIDIIFDQSMVANSFGTVFDLADQCPPTLSSYNLERISLLDVARHEFGHAHGLDHVSGSNQLMYWQSYTGVCKAMDYDDVSGAKYILLTVGPSYLPSCGYTPNPQNFPTSGCNGINGISDIATGSSVRIYPNPNSGSFTLESSQGKDYTIINMLGQLIAHSDISSDKQVVSFTDLPDGIYTLVVHTTTDTKTLKFTIAR
jgi:hypothetical protein